MARDPNAMGRTADSVRRVLDAIEKVDRSFETLSKNWYALPQEVRDANPGLAAWFERHSPDKRSPYTEYPLN